MTATFASLLALDERLVRAGHHPLTPWWQATLAEYYGHETARTLVGRVGRGGAKSHTSVKVGVNELLNGDWSVPPGECHYWVQVSENKVEAAERLRLYESFFSAMRVRFERSGDSIIIPELARGVRIMACQIGAVSGFRCFGYAADELAKWSNADHSANPANEVCVSLDATTVTHPGARSLLISSPFGCSDYHWERFAQGPTADQILASAPSWIANPGITEAQCLKLARGDSKVMEREYRANPQASETLAFEPELVRACQREVFGTHCRNAGLLDMSAGAHDCTAFGVGGWFRPILAEPPGVTVRHWDQEVDGETIRRTVWVHPDGRTEDATRPKPLLMLKAADGVDRWRESSVDIDDIYDYAARLWGTWNAQEVWGDAYYSRATESACRKHGQRYHELNFQSLKAEGIGHLRRTIEAGRFVINPGAPLQRVADELCNYQERILASGNIRYGAKGSGLDDFATLAIVLAIVDLEGGLSGSATHVNRGPGKTIRSIEDRQRIG